MSLAFLELAGLALAHTHQISTPRGFLDPLLPALVHAGITEDRAALMFDKLQDLDRPNEPYGEQYRWHTNPSLIYHQVHMR